MIMFLVSPSISWIISNFLNSSKTAIPPQSWRAFPNHAAGKNIPIYGCAAAGHLPTPLTNKEIEITEIKDRLTLARVLDHYGLQHDPHDRLHCPFHPDKTPSLQVYPKTHTAYCFSSNCKTHGRSLDVIDFVMHRENCTKAEAIKKAELMVNGQLSMINDSNKTTTVDHSPLTVPRTLILDNMFAYFKNAVHNSKPAQEYIKGRGLKKQIQKYHPLG